MKKYFSLAVVLGSMLFITSCAVFSGNKGPAAVAEEAGRSRIIDVQSSIAENNINKLDQIAVLAYGSGYALGKVDNPPREVSVAKDMNDRIVSISGSPSVEQMKEMQETIEKLTSMLQLEREDGKKRLNDKDLQIQHLQLNASLLSKAKESEIRRYMVIAQEAAASADAYKAEMDKMDAWMGLGAVYYGLKTLFVRLMWIFGIGSIIFIVLRIASTTNPIAGSVFSIFNIIGSWVINAIKLIVPKATEFAGETATSVFNAYRSTMYKIIDGIQTLKERQKAEGITKKFTLEELLDELSKSMSDDDKKRIDEIKREIGYF